MSYSNNAPGNRFPIHLARTSFKVKAGGLSAIHSVPEDELVRSELLRINSEQTKLEDDTTEKLNTEPSENESQPTPNRNFLKRSRMSLLRAKRHCHDSNKVGGDQSDADSASDETVVVNGQADDGSEVTTDNDDLTSNTSSAKESSDESMGRVSPEIVSSTETVEKLDTAKESGLTGLLPAENMPSKNTQTSSSMENMKTNVCGDTNPLWRPWGSPSTEKPETVFDLDVAKMRELIATKMKAACDNVDSVSLGLGTSQQKKSLPIPDEIDNGSQDSDDYSHYLGSTWTVIVDKGQVGTSTTANTTTEQNATVKKVDKITIAKLPRLSGPYYPINSSEVNKGTQGSSTPTFDNNFLCAKPESNGIQNDSKLIVAKKKPKAIAGVTKSAKLLKTIKKAASLPKLPECVKSLAKAGTAKAKKKLAKIIQPANTKRCGNPSKKKQSNATISQSENSGKAMKKGPVRKRKNLGKDENDIALKAIRTRWNRQLHHLLNGHFRCMPGTNYRRPRMHLRAIMSNNGYTIWKCLVCGKEEDEDSSCMICCDKCNDWYHVTCIGIRKKIAQACKSWYCKRCIQKAIMAETFNPLDFPLG